jgi:cell division protein FtsB
MPYINDNKVGISIAALATQYDQVLTENINMRQERTDLRRENSAQAAKINSLETEIDKLKEQIKESNIGKEED